MGYKKWRRIAVLLAAIFLLGCSDEIDVVNSDVEEIRESLLAVAKQVPQQKYEDSVLMITPKLSKRIAEKKKENPDTVGWLIVPGTNINDVIVQNPKNYNNYYTSHDFYKQPSKTAAYGADWRCNFKIGTRESLPNNIALYGHSFDENPNGELFSQMKRYKDPEFARTHPYIFFSTEQEDMVWEVFAVYNASIDLPYIVPNLKWKELSNVLDVVYEASIYDYGIKITPDDKLLAVGCCSYSVPGIKGLLPFDVPNRYRFVVMARLVSPYEQVKKAASFSINQNPLPPDAMPAIYHSGNDLFMYRGVVWFNVSGAIAYKDLDLSGGIPLGKIKRTGITMELQDWDAVSLEVGTKVLRHPTNNEILIVMKDGKETPYLKYE